MEQFALPSLLCVHQMFEAQVARVPNRVALVCENQSLTYFELNARANRLANYLRRLGVGPETMVGLFADRSLEMVVGLLGIMKAGGAYLPIDTAYPKDRIGFMLEDAQISLLLTQEPLAGVVAESQARLILLDKEWETIAQESPENLSSETSPDNLAYVIYTSGSTGKPKGCMVTHHNIVRLMQSTEPWFHFNESDVWTMFHSYAFDFSVWEIWGALLYGGRLVIVPYMVSRSPDLFRQLVEQQGVTVLNQTPSAFRQFIHADQTAGNADLALRVVIFGGEALELESLRPWFTRHGDQRPQLVNMYGITETTVHVTYRPLTWQDVLERRGSMIGYPIPDLRLYILDEQLQPAPIDVPGEIFVGGAGVARGYLNRPELTLERFLPDPFSGHAGDRMYRSGDQARRTANGDTEYMGRIDQQVKIRGFRVELGEIEAILRQHPQVQDAVVLLGDSEGDKRLVAHIVPGASRPSTEELRSFLAGKLPSHMVPAAFGFLREVPLTPHGKVDRKALSVLSASADAPASKYLPPRTPLEQKLALIWQEVLKIDRIGVEDNFFHIGGHSLSAMQTVARIRDEHELDVPVSCLFENPTIESLAIAVSQMQASMHSDEEWLHALAEIEAMADSSAEGM